MLYACKWLVVFSLFTTRFPLYLVVHTSLVGSTTIPHHSFLIQTSTLNQPIAIVSFMACYHVNGDKTDTYERSITNLPRCWLHHVLDPYPWWVSHVCTNPWSTICHYFGSSGVRNYKVVISLVLAWCCFRYGHRSLLQLPEQVQRAHQLMESRSYACHLFRHKLLAAYPDGPHTQYNHYPWSRPRTVPREIMYKIVLVCGLSVKWKFSSAAALSVNLCPEMSTFHRPPFPSWIVLLCSFTSFNMGRLLYTFVPSGITTNISCTYRNHWEGRSDIWWRKNKPCKEVYYWTVGEILLPVF